jgi:hypothetical protein
VGDFAPAEAAGCGASATYAHLVHYSACIDGEGESCFAQPSPEKPFKISTHESVILMCAYAVETATKAASFALIYYLLRLMKGVACQSSFLNWDFGIPPLRMFRALITLGVCK